MPAPAARSLAVLIPAVVVALYLFVDASAAVAQSESEYAVSSLNNPPGTRISSRVRKEMERLRSKGIYDVTLQEMKARGLVDKRFEGQLVQADRMSDPRAKVDAYEGILEQIHPLNLGYQLKVLTSIQRHALPAKFSQQEYLDVAVRRATVQAEICRIKVAGYKTAVPEERYAKSLEEAHECLVRHCKNLEKLGSPCPEAGNGGRLAPAADPAPPVAGTDTRQPAAMSLFYVTGLAGQPDLQVHAKPDFSSQVVAVLPKGSQVGVAGFDAVEGARTSWINVCPKGRECGWVPADTLTSVDEVQAARRAVDSYLIALISSSVEGMRDLTAGQARKHIDRLITEHPEGRMSDLATEQPQQWRGRCAICAGGYCQALFDITTSVSRQKEEIVFKTIKGGDGKMRVANSTPYAGEAKQRFDGFSPVCW